MLLNLSLLVFEKYWYVKIDIFILQGSDDTNNTKTSSWMLLLEICSKPAQKVTIVITEMDTGHILLTVELSIFLKKLTYLVVLCVICIETTRVDRIINIFTHKQRIERNQIQ